MKIYKTINIYYTDYEIILNCGIVIHFTVPGNIQETHSRFSGNYLEEIVRTV